MGYLMPKPSLSKNNYCTIYFFAYEQAFKGYLILNLCRRTVLFNTLLEEDKGVHTFPKGNVILRLEFKLTCWDVTVHLVNHYTTEAPQYPWERHEKLSNFTLFEAPKFSNLPRLI